MVWWLAPSPHSERVPGSIPGWGLSVWSLHVLPLYVWVLSGFSGFLLHVRLICDSKSSLRLSMHGCVSHLSLCGPVMNWQPCLLPNDSWDRLQRPRDPKLEYSGVENGWRNIEDDKLQQHVAHNMGLFPSEL